MFYVYVLCGCDVPGPAVPAEPRPCNSNVGCARPQLLRAITRNYCKAGTNYCYYCVEPPTIAPQGLVLLRPWHSTFAKTTPGGELLHLALNYCVRRIDMQLQRKRDPHAKSTGIRLPSPSIASHGVRRGPPRAGLGPRSPPSVAYGFSL